MAFPWIQLFRSRGIEYVEHGPNVAKGHVNIQCPFCGDRDHSHHMGIQEETGFWGCWRDTTHRGRRPERLLVQLLGCTWKEAKDMAAPDGAPLEGLESLRARLGPQGKGPQEPLQTQQFLPNFKRITHKGLQRIYFNYLRKRGFGEDTKQVIRDYDLRCAISGPFKQRIIFPFYQHGQLVGWTGRAIGKAVIRYKTYPSGSGVNRILFNHDQAMTSPDRKVLAICEGPIDALKVDFYGKWHGVRAVALLGLDPSDAKLSLIGELIERGRYNHVGLLLDPDALAKAMSMVGSLNALGAPVSILSLPRGVEDPGALEPDQVWWPFRRILPKWHT